MRYNNIELSENHSILIINDLSEIHNLKENTELLNTKIILTLNNIEQLNYLNSSNLLDENGLHISLLCSKQIFQMLNINNLLNKSILKSISVHDLEITINLYLSNEVDKKILDNNIKIVETIKYSKVEIEIKSKIHEVLYHANTILKNFKKKDNQLNTIKNVVNKL